MIWQKIPYWLKGLLIGLILGLFVAWGVDNFFPSILDGLFLIITYPVAMFLILIFAGVCYPIQGFCNSISLELIFRISIIVAVAFYCSFLFTLYGSYIKKKKK